MCTFPPGGAVQAMQAQRARQFQGGGYLLAADRAAHVKRVVGDVMEASPAATYAVMQLSSQWIRPQLVGVAARCRWIAASDRRCVVRSDKSGELDLT